MKLNLKSNQLKILLRTFKGKLPGLPFHSFRNLNFRARSARLLRKLDHVLLLCFQNDYFFKILWGFHETHGKIQVKNEIIF